MSTIGGEAGAGWVDLQETASMATAIARRVYFMVDSGVWFECMRHRNIPKRSAARLKVFFVFANRLMITAAKLGFLEITSNPPPRSELPSDQGSWTMQRQY